jgi:hypothetical protein
MFLLFGQPVRLRAFCVCMLTRRVPNVRPRLNAHIINAKLGNVSDRLCGQCHDTPENGVPARLNSHGVRNTHAKSAASCQANNLDHLEESCSHTGRRGNKRGQTLGKDFSWAGRHITEKFPHCEQNTRLPAQYWEDRSVCVDSDCEYG